MPTFPPSHDRAAVVTRSVLQLVTQHILAADVDHIPLHAAVAALLRDEFAAVQHQAISEIRLPDE
jgi:hypothetical protein